MTRRLTFAAGVTVVLILLALAGAGETRSAKTARPRGAATQPRLIEMKVRPAPEPRFALRWHLLPDLLDQTPGNAAVLYCTATDLAGVLKAADMDRVRAWLEMDPPKLPRKAVVEFLGNIHGILRQLELAARRERCDWGLPIRSEGFSLILPPLSKYRDLARVLSLKARLHIAAGRHDQAVHEIQTGLAMARHLSEAPTLIHALVATAVASQMLQDVECLIEAAGSPNLYWALAGLPRPFVDARKSLAYEASSLYLAVPKLRAALTQQRTAEEWRALAEEIVKIFQVTRGLPDQDPSADAKGRLALTAMAVYAYPRAKTYLRALGKTPEQIEAMPVHQALVIYYLDGYERLRGEVFKWHALPYWQAHEGLQRAGRLMNQAKRKTADAFGPLAWLVPNLSRSRFLMARLDRQIAALQCVEAVRMYAAGHDGKPPAGLSDIRDAPCPIDPVTGKPFAYRAVGQTITLDAPAPPGLPATEGVRYRITLVKP